MTQKYLAVNLESKEEFLCEKIEVEGFDYYVSDEQATENFYGYINFQGGNIKKIGKYFADDWEKVIATTNPSLPIPKVVDEVEEMSEKEVEIQGWGKYEGLSEQFAIKSSFEQGYNTAKQNSPFTEQDMLKFSRYAVHNFINNNNNIDTFNELLEIWKSQKKILIYFK